jgi:hypothetical protein
MEIDKPIKRERKPKPGKCMYCEIESPDLATHVEVEHGILLGDLAAVIQQVILKITDLESQIKQANRQI